VLDVETVGVDIIANQISEADGNGATQARVFRTNVDGPFPYTSRQAGSRTIAQTILDYDKTASQITVPAQTSRLSDVNVTLNLKHGWLADLDIYLISPAGTRVELVTDLNGNGSLMTNTTFDDQALGSILSGTDPFTGKFRPQGFLNALNGENPSGIWTLEITDDNESDFGTLFSWSLDIETKGLAPQLVTLSLTGDPGEISVQQSVTIPANQAGIMILVNALDDTLLDGTQIAGIQANGDTPGFELGNDNVDVLDQETLTFTVSQTRVSEKFGSNALTGTLTRFNTDISLPFTVSVSSSDTSELTIGMQPDLPTMPVNPMSVTIPAGETYFTFDINTVDDVIVDGDQTVLISVSAPAYGADLSRTVIVEDLESSLQLTTGTPIVAENAGSFTVTVSRLEADLSTAMDVSLTVGSELGFGPGMGSNLTTVTIPIGLDSVTFSVGIKDNAILDGTRSANIHATASLITAGDLEITIADYETLTVTVDKLSFLENAGAKAAIGTVRRSNTENLGQPLVVTLGSSDQTELNVPAMVTILAGQETATFYIDAVNDPALDGTQNVTLTASAIGYVNGTVGVAVEDHEPPVLTGPTATTPSSRPLITWNALSGALRYEVWITNLTTNVAAIVRDINVPTNSFVPPENLGIGRYRVWVRAIDSLEQPGYWSVGRDFFINTPATITSPTKNTVIASSKFPTIVWSAIPDAVKYELWVNNMTTGQKRVINRAGATALTTTSYVATENLPSGTYQIWVRGLNASGESGLWSLPTTHTVLAQPVITQPSVSGTFDTTPIFAWTAVISATSYDLYVADAKTKVVVLRNQFVKTTSLTATNDIPSGAYTVWVRAQSGNSLGAWSNPIAFSIGLPPKITSAKTVGTPDKPQQQYTWTTIAGTERYELWVNNAANVRVINETNLKNTTFTTATTLPVGTYRVWVRAVSTMGQVTAWSAPVELVVASSVLPKGSVDSAQIMILTALNVADGPLTPDGSPVERPDASTFAVDVPVQADRISDTEVAPASVTKANGPVEPAPTMVSEHDAVMSEWQSAEWWTGTSETQDRKELHSAAAIAASLGVVVRNGQRSGDGRKRKW
jgi:subtilisin-like proprotein convertase family protein